MIVMSEKESDDQNYKGLLQQYWLLRGVEPPTYGSAQCGSSHQPSWLVTVEYGDKNHKTSEPIIGSKKMAEQIAAKQIVKEIDITQKAFLAGEPITDVKSEEHIEISEAKEVLTVSSELVATAMGMANHRLSETRRGDRYRESSDSKRANQAFSQNLASLTMTIVRELVNAAEEANIEFGYEKRGEGEI